VAEAPGHRLGQIIGTVLELAIEPILQKVAHEHDLYLDRSGDRPARPGRKLTWQDDLGNKHDLDYVLERGGDKDKIGLPAAFIETAWRRYTKHSRNKAQEIQGAILPLIAKYSHLKPFPGVVLAGVFTDGSLNQLRSNGFAVLYIPYEEIIAAFANFGIDVKYDEGTSDAHLRKQIAKYDSLSAKDRLRLGEALRKTAPGEFKAFDKSLRAALGRRVERVIVVPLHGDTYEFGSVNGAIDLLRVYKPTKALPIRKFEISVRYSNGDTIVATFQNAEDAIDFLETYS
jgi:hypothetical protein